MRIYVWIWKTFSFSNRSCSQKFQWKGGITEESFPCSWIIQADWSETFTPLPIVISWESPYSVCGIKAFAFWTNRLGRCDIWARIEWINNRTGRLKTHQDRISAGTQSSFWFLLVRWNPCSQFEIPLSQSLPHCQKWSHYRRGWSGHSVSLEVDTDQMHYHSLGGWHRISAVYTNAFSPAVCSTLCTVHIVWNMIHFVLAGVEECQNFLMPCCVGW